MNIYLNKISCFYFVVCVYSTLNIFSSSWTVVILLVADHPSKELLTEYTVPLGHLKPFHQYHLELVQVPHFEKHLAKLT